MTVLRAIDAAFADPRDGTIGPFGLTLRDGERVALETPSPRAASIAARMFAAIVKPTTGAIYVGDYDTRLQPPQAKRRLGFVDCAGFGGNAHAFACEAAFRAEVWGLDVAGALDRARRFLVALEAPDSSYARGVALALVPDVTFVVLDQPEPAILDVLHTIVPSVAVVATRVTGNVSASPPVVVHS